MTHFLGSFFVTLYLLTIPVAFGIVEVRSNKVNNLLIIVTAVFWPISLFIVLYWKFWMGVGAGLYLLYTFGKRLGSR